jgi:hypothetical protein
MANVFMSGFEWGTKYEVTWWDAWEFCSISTDVVRSGNYSIKFYGAYSSIMQSLPGSKNDYYVQFAWYTDGAFGGLSGDLFAWYGAAGDRRIGVFNISDSGQARLYSITHPDGLNELQTLRATGTQRLQVGKWYVFELHIKADQTYGVLSLRIDGIPDCEFMGATSEFSPGTVDSFIWRSWSCYLDDIVINDTTGSFNNAWPGCLKVVLLRPNDDGNYSDWTPSIDGHNYDCVNEVPYDPTQYIHTTGLDVRDTYGVENLPVEAGEVAVVRGDAWAFKDSGSEANNRKLAFSVQPTSTPYDSPDVDLSLSYRLVNHPFDYNPETSAAWTKEEVDNILAGIKSRA